MCGAGETSEGRKLKSGPVSRPDRPARPGREPDEVRSRDRTDRTEAVRDQRAPAGLLRLRSIERCSACTAERPVAPDDGERGVERGVARGDAAISSAIDLQSARNKCKRARI